jgi:hypothetical protein
MQIANVMVALGGDKGTTVPKYGVTASEIQVLRAIHGNEAVFDIEPLPGVALSARSEPDDPITRSDREEIQRLHDIYSRAGPDGQLVGPVSQLFPGGPLARAFTSIDQIGIDEEFFKPLTRAKAEPAKAAKAGKKAPKSEPAEPETDEKLFD